MIYGAPMLGLPGWQCRCPRAESWNTAASVYCDGCDTHAPRADPLSVECPRCHSPAGVRCHHPNHGWMSAHRERLP
jgi:hypothetical protein